MLPRGRGAEQGYPNEALVVAGRRPGTAAMSSSAELAVQARIDVEEEGQVKVAVLPEGSLVIDAGLLVFADDTLLRARWRDLLQWTDVVQGVEHLELGHILGLGTARFVAGDDDLGGMLAVVQRVPFRILETRNGRDNQTLGATDPPAVTKITTHLDKVII